MVFNFFFSSWKIVSIRENVIVLWIKIETQKIRGIEKDKYHTKKLWWFERILHLILVIQSRLSVIHYKLSSQTKHRKDNK